MSYYFVDFENVRINGVKNLVGIKNGDTVTIFFSDQCKNITLDVIEDLTRNGVQINCYKAKTGTKNALDFQLSSYLGCIIGKGSSDENYYIVSNDKGYDCLCGFWKEQGKTVIRMPSLGINKKTANTDLVTMDEINKYLSKGDRPEDVLVIVNQCKTKQAICDGMAKKFKDSKKAGALYKKLKPLLEAKNKS